MKNALLSHYPLSFTPFSKKELYFELFSKKNFVKLGQRARFKKINKTLLGAIEEEASPCFLLGAVSDFISEVNEQNLLQQPYTLSAFEFWLNNFSGLKKAQELEIRAKISGKKIPRDAYQVFFPIGMNRYYNGAHFVAAHFAPDVDTTIASFWGFIDAFSAKVATSTHYWNLPKKSVDAHIASLMDALFGKGALAAFARGQQELILTAQDLLSQKEFVKLDYRKKSNQIDHLYDLKPIVVVDEDDFFLGSLYPSELEITRQILFLFFATIRWLQSQIQEIFIKNKTKKDLQDSLKTLFSLPIRSSEPIATSTEKQRRLQQSFLQRIIGLKKGLNATLFDLIENDPILQSLLTITNTTLFEKKERDAIFSELYSTYQTVDQLVKQHHEAIDNVKILLSIKEEVLGITTITVTPQSDVVEIQTKIGSHEYLPVVFSQEEGKKVCIGVVYAIDIKQKILGTVSLRDFSNTQETAMAPYLEIISVIDHHKSQIQTTSSATIISGDTQSANTIVAELAIAINKERSTLGLSLETIQKQKKALNNDLLSSIRQEQRLSELLVAAQKKNCFIHPDREYAEYLCFLYAILDDTDLLTKVSRRDLECVKTLLNRMKTIQEKRDIEIVSFSEIAEDDHFTQNAKNHLLQNEDLYSLYKSVFQHKEEEVKKAITLCLEDRSDKLFSDTKELNGTSRVGQIKLFSSTLDYFSKHVDEIQSYWVEKAQRLYLARAAIDLHMQMVSTISSADEVYRGKEGKWQHEDALWIWVPQSSAAMSHLIHFLNSFSRSDFAKKQDFTVHFSGPKSIELEHLFRENFPAAKIDTEVKGKSPLSFCVISYKAGLINSRKALISPHLPTR